MHVSDRDYTRMFKRESKMGKASAKADRDAGAQHSRAEVLGYIGAQKNAKRMGFASAVTASFWAGYLSQLD